MYVWNKQQSNTGENVLFAFDNTHLKASHVARIAGIFQAILIAFEEEFQKEPVRKKHK